MGAFRSVGGADARAAGRREGAVAAAARLPACSHGRAIAGVWRRGRAGSASQGSAVCAPSPSLTRVCLQSWTR
jgi:hypothetical protein